MKKTLSFMLAVLMLFTTFALPTVAEENVASAAEIVNLYSFYRSNGKLVAENGTVSESTDISSNSLITIEAGQTLYFGPCAEGEVYLATYAFDGSFIARIAASDCTIVSTLEDGSVIYSYVLPDNAASVWCAADNAYAMDFLLTEGQPFDGAVLAEYRAINPLTGKSALFLGDSIAYGANSGGKAWAEAIAAANDMTYVKAAKSAWSVSTIRASQYGMIVDQLLANKDTDFDYIVLHGGANDAWDNVEMGTLTNSFDPSTFDIDTFVGGFENLIYNTLYYYGDTAAIGYIANFSMPSHDKVKDWGDYEIVAEQICEKWGITYFDMYENTKIIKELDITSTTHSTDGCHPSASGYEILSPMVEGFMKTLTVKEKSAAPTEGVKVTFLDRKGEPIAVLGVDENGKLCDYVMVEPTYSDDALVYYDFAGWALNGQAIDAYSYTFTEDTTLTATYAEKYGAIFDDLDPIPLNKPDENGVITQQELLPEQVKMNPNSVGMTIVYKIEGADTEIIADNWITYVNGRKLSSGQWNKPQVTDDNNPLNYLELNNGYYFIYLNHNISGYWAVTPDTFDSFLLFCPDNGTRYSTTRTPTNDNENATFQMLAVVNDNLQPTVTFHNEDGSVITSYQHKYTDITKNLGLNYTTDSYKEGQILTPNAIFLQAKQADTTLVTPEKEGLILSGWADADGNIVDGVYKNIDVYPVFSEANEDDKVTATFLDKDGNTVATMKNYPGYLIPEKAPEVPAVAGDGILTYSAKGWTVDGSVVDPDNYLLTEDVTFVAAYNVYGAKFDSEPIALNKPGEDGTIPQQDVLPAQVKMDPSSTGMTLVYKIEGADTEIIADNWITYTNGRKLSSGQWGKTTVTGDGNPINYLELNNGYYFIYLNQNINGYWATTPNTFDNFLLFCPDNGNRYSTTRTPTNDNENATFKMLAVVNNNLQPIATFRDTQGGELATYQHKYTDINKNIGLNYNLDSYEEGKLLSITEVQTLAAVETPVKAPTHGGKVTYEFAGWVDAEGNAVEALYYNVDLYPSFKVASDERAEYTVKFVDEDGTELYSVKVREEDMPEYVGEEPAKAADKKNTYEFAGWDAEIVAATADVTYKATYTATAIEYTVTFMNGEDEVAKATTTYEGAVEAPADPTKDATAEFTYHFASWVDAEDNSVDLNKITDNITVYAKFTSTTNKYTVTFMDGETELSKSTVDYGTAAVKPADPTKEATAEFTYTFAGWVDSEGKAADLNNVVADITVYPSYTSTINKYTVTFMNGEAEYEKVSVDYGTEAKATAEPTKETANFTKYTFAGWVDLEGNAVDLTKVEADVTVYASYTTECEHNFPDIKDGAWYESAVEWALMNGVMNGEGAKFNPDKATTRGMIVTVLYRLEGSPDVSGVEHPFTDIKEGQWYYDAVKWAYSKGVVNGMSATTYVPGGTLTREQFATILYRYAKEIKGEDVSVDESANLDAYTDKAKVSAYALDAVLWTNVNGYIGGTSATTLSPKGSATRAQMATILYRYITAK